MNLHPHRPLGDSKGATPASVLSKTPFIGELAEGAGVLGNPQKNTVRACPVEGPDSIGKLAEVAGRREEEPWISLSCA